ncbi:MAG TPA: Lsr2 family protein [Umezawaea sp.]|nr:Lsr2 family protein [Umezawaea sp.]
MAQQMIIELVDDLDGGAADETVTFGLDGVDYQIDLSGCNATRLRDELAAFVAHGRRTGVAGRRIRAAPPAPTDHEQNQRIRAWAREAGFLINDRGRISAEIIDKFHAAQG